MGEHIITTSNSDTAALVSQSQQGNTEAFSQLYDVFAERIFRFIRMKVSNSTEAEDILQDVFVKAWHGLQSSDVPIDNFSAWLYRIASNTVNDHFRKVYRRPQIVVELDETIDVAADDNPADDAAMASDLDNMRACLEELVPQYRHVLELRFVQDFDISETARILKKTTLTTRVLQHRALRQLKNIMDKRYGI